MTRISKKKQVLLDAECEAKLQAIELLISTYHNKVFKATVRWFDNMSGTGMVTIDKNLSLAIYACAIKGCKTWFPETACVYYKPGQVIDIKITVGSLTNLIVEGLTKGRLDTKRWNSIKKQKLAFRCDSSGKAINGLFE